MRGHAEWLALAAIVAMTVLAIPSAGFPSSDKSKLPAIRWDEQSPGCTFSRSDDGKYHYGMWSGDIGITVAVDSQELEKVHRRHEQFFAVLLNMRYRGQESLDVGPGNVSLEFVRHFRIVQQALDPDGFSQKVQNDADTLNDQTAREIKKHPEKADEREKYMRGFLKDAAELQEFVGKNSLRATHLDASNSEASGWVLFSTQSKWISGWKKPEQFVLRVALGGKMYEFPFQLPPKPGDVMLRKRQ
jgi:hypothetical protein